MSRSIMLDLRYVTENLEEVKAALGRRGFEDESVLTELAERDTERRALIVETDGLRAERNAVSKAMASIADKKSEEFGRQREAMREVGDRIKALEEKQRDIDASLERVLSALPNLPDATTPDGRDETSNVEVRSWGEKPAFDFEPKDHHDLGVALGIVDFERAARISGARFSILRGGGARLERALVAFMLDLHGSEHGYEEVWPPVLVRDSALYNTSQLPKFAQEQFRIASEEGWTQHQESGGELYLSPTAEVQLTNLHAGEILDADSLPRAYTAFTPCFRAEAGSYGKDTRGLIRQHQFDKVELVRVCRPDQGPEQLELLTSHAEEVLKRLGLHYRVVQLCAGDMGFAATKTYDLEVWLPGQNAYREISSCSWCGDFQARRAKLRFRPAPRGNKKAKPELAHTLNGSGLAVGRTLVAILEQNQQADGSVTVPEALRPYTGGMEVIPTPGS